MIIVILTILLKNLKQTTTVAANFVMHIYVRGFKKTEVYLPFTIAEKLNQTSY